MFVNINVNAQFKLGANLGLQSPTEEGAKTLFGGGINGEYLVMSNIGIGLTGGLYHPRWN